MEVNTSNIVCSLQNEIANLVALINLNKLKLNLLLDLMKLSNSSRTIILPYLVIGVRSLLRPKRFMMIISRSVISNKLSHVMSD